MEAWGKHDLKFRYLMLSRMKTDCDYYLGNGNFSTNHLWAGNEKDQILNMISIWCTFDQDESPEWLTWNDIMDYAKKMGVVTVIKPNIKYNYCKYPYQSE